MLTATRIRRLLVPLTAMLLVAAGPVETVSDGWHALARLQFAEARQTFEQMLRHDPDSALARLGLAAALLNVQPQLAGNLARAEQLCREIYHFTPDDPYAPDALYLHARIQQLHVSPPSPANAIDLYERLITAYPGHPLAQMALVKIAMIRLYASNHDEATAVFHELEQRGQALDDPDARRDFHLMMATAAARLDLGVEASLRHLLAADEAGVVRRRTAGDVFVRIANLARHLEQVELAERYERRFIQEFPRDTRTYTLRLRLEQGNATIEVTP